MITKTNNGWLIDGMVRYIDTPFIDNNGESNSTEMINIVDDNVNYLWKDIISEYIFHSSKGTKIYYNIGEKIHDDREIAMIYLKLKEPKVFHRIAYMLGLSNLDDMFDDHAGEYLTMLIEHV